MKSVFLLFDSLVLKALESYGGTEIATPNFNRLADKGVQFNTHYVGSLPCIPARRDLHTGRLNFMHRGWGPLEPFDNSWVRILREQGVHCHLITDHNHYFESGGMGYHNVFSSWEFIRGQEFDNWKALPPDEKFARQYNNQYDSRHYPVSDDAKDNDGLHRRRQHMVNSAFMKTESDHCTPRCFASAFEFLDHNATDDNWMLWLECFDPHEPFHIPQRLQEKYGIDSCDKLLNWPLYGQVQEGGADIAKIRSYYMALLDMCDEYLGKMLDYFDTHNLWDDTAFIVTTDHGFLLSEHDYWGKNRQPYYEEISHIPLFIYHPHYTQQGGTQRYSLTQTPDIMPTLLDMYGAVIPDEVQAKSLMPLLDHDQQIHQAVLFGAFGGPIGVTDGQYVYFHHPDLNGDGDFHPAHLSEYTLTPMHMHDYFSIEELKTMQLCDGFDFTKGLPVLKIKTYQNSAGHYAQQGDLPHDLGTGLFDVLDDPQQCHPIADKPKQIEILKQHICRILNNHHAPKEFYQAYHL